tara:strand:- start:1677 stop:1943 length:267 start_codon:yes stop_codon:yes gene_type:complete
MESTLLNMSEFMPGELLEATVGCMLLNFDNKDPQWRHEAGFIAELLELDGAPIPHGKTLSGICRVAGETFTTREEIIKWGKAQELKIN